MRIKIKTPDFFLIWWIVLSLLFLEIVQDLEPYSIGLFIINVAVLIVYVLGNIKNELIKNKTLSLSLLFVIFQFGIQAGFGSLSLLFGKQRSNSGWYYLNKAEILSLIGCICVCIIMRSSFAQNIGWRVEQKLIGTKKTNTSISVLPAIFMFVVSTIAFLYCMRIGVYGYADNTNLTGYSSYSSISQYLIYVADLGNLLTFMCYYTYLRDANFLTGWLYRVFLVIRVLLALLSGMKKELIAIFVCMFFINYWVKKRFSARNIFLIFISILVGYMIIEIYRSILRGDSVSGNRLSMLIEAASSSSISIDNTTSDSLVFKFLSRLNIVEPCSKILYYKTEVGLQSTDPSFLLDLILLPFTIFIPRALMPLKPSSGEYGLWVTHTVMGMPESILSSSYVTVQGCLYLAGGIICVIVGFLCIGAVLEFATGFLKDFSNPALLGTFMMITFKAVLEPATPTGMITLIIRGLIIYTLFGNFVLKKQNIPFEKNLYTRGDTVL